MQELILLVGKWTLIYAGPAQYDKKSPQNSFNWDPCSLSLGTCIE